MYKERKRHFSPGAQTDRLYAPHTASGLSQPNSFPTFLRIAKSIRKAQEEPLFSWM